MTTVPKLATGGGLAMDPWKLHIPNVRLNAHSPFTASVTLSPGEKALIAQGLLRRDELTGAYREAIERGDYTTFGFIGSAPAEVVERVCK